MKLLKLERLGIRSFFSSNFFGFFAFWRDSRNVNKLSRIFPETRIFIKKNLQKGKYAVSSQYENKLSRIFVCLDRSFFYSFFWFFDGILIDLTGWLVRNKLVSTWPESNNGIEYLRKDTNVRPFKESHF